MLTYVVGVTWNETIENLISIQLSLKCFEMSYPEVILWNPDLFHLWTRVLINQNYSIDDNANLRF